MPFRHRGVPYGSPQGAVCVCRLLGLMGLRKGEIEPFQVHPIYHLERGGIRSRPYYSEEDREPKRSAYKVWGVSSTFHNREVCFPNVYSGLLFKPKLSSLIARNENRTKLELSVDIKQILSSCYHTSSNQSKLQRLGILSHRVVNVENSFLRLPWNILSISSEEDTVSLWDPSTKDKTFLLSLVFT